MALAPVRTPLGRAHDFVFNLLVAAAALPDSPLPTPSFDEEIARPTDLALNFQGHRTEAWLNLRPADARYLFSEVGTSEIRHMQVECVIEWVVIGPGTRPGEADSPRRARFEAGLLALSTALGSPRAVQIDNLGTAFFRLTDQPLALAGDRSVLAAIPNVSACSLTTEILMAVPSPIG